ncbi:hypothetical protein [Nocardia farcinica]|uniref:hypothetical protein n=1 Tax=Nocardia farcinica TaxID=37329 RepID=UPI00245747F3|nr:hypothetical protein [Nocardia farcinica]
MPARRGSVLIVAAAGDPHAAAVAEIVREVHGLNAIQLDPADYPRNFGSFRLGRLGTARSLAQSVGLDDARAVWWRPPHPATAAGGTAAEAHRRAECDNFLEGMLWSIPAHWVNDPASDRTACRHIVQWETALRAGLCVPETLVTNDPDEARSFAESRPGPVVFKRGAGAGPRLVDRADLAAAGLRRTPATFQDYVPADCDLRVVWVDGVEWAVRIDVPPGVDRFADRPAASLGFGVAQLPASVSKSLATLMGALGLGFGVLDLRLGLDGEYWFLEVDPRGRFEHLVAATGLPMFRSVADLLAEDYGPVTGH